MDLGAESVLEKVLKVGVGVAAPHPSEGLSVAGKSAVSTVEVESSLQEVFQSPPREEACS
jgi:hypothetical protein